MQNRHSPLENDRSRGLRVPPGGSVPPPRLLKVLSKNTIIGHVPKKERRVRYVDKFIYTRTRCGDGNGEKVVGGGVAGLAPGWFSRFL